MLEQGSIDKSVNDFFTNMKQPQLPYGFYRTFSLWRRASVAGDGLRRSTARTYDENTLAVVLTSFPPLLSQYICHPGYLSIHISPLTSGTGSMRPARRRGRVQFRDAAYRHLLLRHPPLTLSFPPPGATGAGIILPYWRYLSRLEVGLD